MEGPIIFIHISLFFIAFSLSSLNSNLQIRVKIPNLNINIFRLYYFYIVKKCTQNKVQHDA
jgi:hypothetical protein